MIDLFTEITSRSNIKAVVSSRPENLFSIAFKGLPFLEMETLTKKDMVHYVRAKLGKHPRTVELVAQEPGFLEDFAECVASQSSGVFLWTSLAVKLLRETLDGGCFAYELRAVLDAYPQELDDLYRHMFERMNKYHRVEGYQILQCVHHAEQVEGRIPSLLRFWFLVSSSPGSSIGAETGLLDRETFAINLEFTATRIKSRCCGLLESKWKSSMNDYYEGQVVPFHRTVSDFLREPSILEMMERETINFNPSDKLLESILWCLKKKWFYLTKTVEEWRDLKNYLGYAIEYLRHRGDASPTQTAYIDAIDNVMLRFWAIKQKETRSKATGRAFGDYDRHWSQNLLKTRILKHTDASEHHPIVWLALCFDLEHVVKCKAETELSHWDDGWGYIFAMLTCSAMYLDSPSEKNIEIIRTLARKSKDFQLKTSTKKALWCRCAWEILILLQPLKFNMIHLPADIRKIAARCESEISAFARWATLVNILIDLGSRLDHLCTLFDSSAMSVPARTLIEKGISFSSQISDLSATDHEKVRHTIELLQKSLTDNPPTVDYETARETFLRKGRKQASVDSAMMADCLVSFRMKSGKYMVQTGIRNPSSLQDDTLAPQGTGSIQSPTGSKRIPGNSRNSSTSQDNNGGSLVAETDERSTLCFTCKAVRELTAMDFQATEIMDAVDNSGVNPDVRALTIWILDRQETTQGRLQRAMISGVESRKKAQQCDLVSSCDSQATGRYKSRSCWRVV